jgi:DNA-binding transcriptional ArsR family regulator
MLRLRLSVTDLAEVSFAWSALQETVFSLRAWRLPGRYASHLPWLRALHGGEERLDREALRALVTERRWVPDFSTPRPTSPMPDIAAEFAALRATPLDAMLADLERTYQGLPWPAVFAGAHHDPAGTLDRIATALERYWEVCVAPWWPRIRAVLEADVVYRSRRLALGGAQALFADLDARISWHDGVLRVANNHTDADVTVAGRGLPLTPTLFATGALTLIDPTAGPPMIAYPARGRATVFEPTPPAAPGALAALLGEPRARLLALLDGPATTTELAYRLAVTPSAVSQQLAVLHAAGLLNRARSGRTVLYARSRLGDDLVGA